MPRWVESEASPWFGYLSTVYSGHVRLPFDLQTLEVVYPGLLPTASHRCPGRSPWPPYERPGRQLLPNCTEATCSSWLRTEDEALADRARRPGFAKGYSHIWTPLETVWNRSGAQELRDLARSGADRSPRRLGYMNFFVGWQSSRRRNFVANEWVEVRECT